MDVIKVIESFVYYHSLTGKTVEYWQIWRIKAIDEWKLDRALIDGRSGDHGRRKEVSRCKGRFGNHGMQSRTGL